MSSFARLANFGPTLLKRDSCSALMAMQASANDLVLFPSDGARAAGKPSRWRLIAKEAFSFPPSSYRQRRIASSMHKDNEPWPATICQIVYRRRAHFRCWSRIQPYRSGRWIIKGLKKVGKYAAQYEAA